MQTTGTNNTENWDNWALTVLKIWHEKMDRMHIWHTGAGYDSLMNHVINHANGNLPRIEFFFLKYLIYVDAGVGRNYNRGNSGRVDKVDSQRQRKIWYSRTAYAEYMKVNEYIQKRYGEQAGMAFIENVKRHLAANTK